MLVWRDLAKRDGERVLDEGIKRTKTDIIIVGAGKEKHFYYVLLLMSLCK